MALVASVSIVLTLAGWGGVPEPSSPPPIALPGPVACTYHQDSRWRLVLGPGAPFAKVEGDLDLILPVTSDPEFAGGRVETGGISVAGLVEARDVDLHAVAAFVVGQVLVPHPSVKLEWVYSEPGIVGVTFEPSFGVRVPLGDGHASRRCSDLSLRERKFDPFTAVGGRGLGRKALLSADGPVPLAARVGGPGVGELIGAKQVIVLAVQKGQSRIAWEGDNVLAFGWVPSRYLVPRSEDSSDYGTIGLGTLGTIGKGPPPIPLDDRVSCPIALPLIAEAGAERRTVGTIGPRVVMVVEHGLGRDGFSSVHFPGAKIEVAMGARLLVHSSDVDRCRIAGDAPVKAR